MNKSFILIHTALPIEAKELKKELNLKPISKGLFKNEDIILIVSGAGKKNAINALSAIFDKFQIKKAINFGIAGCKSEKIKIGTLFCTTHKLKNIPFSQITTEDEPLKDFNKMKTDLVDMESQHFLEISLKHLSKEDIFIFKVVSDYGNFKGLNNHFINSILSPNVKKVLKYVQV